MKNIIFNNNIIKDTWNKWASDYVPDNQEKVAQIIKTPNKAFPAKVWERLRLHFPSFEGVKVCVPSSGDNKAAFAFHLFGADVTSCDISCKQIEKAMNIARIFQLDNIDFRVLDSMNLSTLTDESYDLVYTSNGVYVWISDLYEMFSGFKRILKKGGKYISFDTHPFIRPFDDSSNELIIKKRYDDISVGDTIPNYHWRVQDIVNVLIQSGFAINSLDELFAQKDSIGASWWNLSEWDEKSDITINPYSALPQWISLCCAK